MASTLHGYSSQPNQSVAALAHLPGSSGWPLIGDSLEFLADPLKYCERVHGQYGPVSRASFLFRNRVNLLSAEANEFVLLDRGRIFSAYEGWEPVLGHLFPRGLMLRDGDDHRIQRRLMQPAFRKESLARYLERMNPRIVTTLAEWRRKRDLKFYPEVKRLTLAIAADVFLGLELQSEIDQVNDDFTAVVDASSAVVRVRVIGRCFRRGLAARARLVSLLGSKITDRRAGTGSDLFSQLCRAEDEDGRRYDDSAIIDHLIFVMMAAHDTTTSALTTIAYALAKHLEWQTRLRDQVASIHHRALGFDDLEQLQEIDWVLREALRLYPPLTMILRRANQPFEIHGLQVPAGTPVNLCPVFTQRQEKWWTTPASFDPERFSPARAEHKRHPFAWIPFGGGAHMCLGLHFAEMQVKAVLHPLLQQVQLSVPASYRIPYRLAPIAHPLDGLPMRLEPI
jgi:cytochrome P450